MIATGEIHPTLRTKPLVSAALLDFEWGIPQTKGMKISSLSSAAKFVSGLVVGAVLFSGSAVAYNAYVSDNTPENGYLLCANLKTKAVTFPNKLSCPAGTRALDLGAVTGVEGPEGPEGPQGPEGPRGLPGTSGTSTTGKIYWGTVNSPIDIVADGSITTGANMVKKIIYTLNASEVPSGAYKLWAHVGALWSDAAKVGSYAECYFQADSSYVAKGNSREWGAGMIEKGSWNSFDLNVHGNWFPALEPKMHLICSTSGTIKGIGAMVEATSYVNAGQFTGAARS